jgi:hypothetical protein
MRLGRMLEAGAQLLDVHRRRRRPRRILPRSWDQR